jgi:Na+-translocating membrane potential-generating system MpsC-like protein
VFEGGYTKAEQTLWGRGRPDTALAYRRAVLDALDADLHRIVEEAVDRRVRVILSSAQHEPDVMAIVFLLEPEGSAAGADGDGAGPR